MRRRMQGPGRLPSPPARTRLGATVEPFLIRTPGEAEQVWPLAEAILSSHTIKHLAPKEQRFLLAAFRRYSSLAYRCLRWARWMTSNRKLEVICLKCRLTTAWSHTMVSSTSHIDQGKWRWVCPLERLDPKGCGGRFCDTTDTPFSHASLSPGLVFAALAYPSGVIQQLLQKNRQTLELRHLHTVLHGVETMADRKLQGRLTQYARLFCGTVLLGDCAELTRSFDGVEALEARLRSLHRSKPVVEEYAVTAIRERKESYTQLRKLASVLQYLDKDSPSGQTSQRLEHRMELWGDLRDVVQTIRDPINPAPMDLQALLAEASLPSP